MRTVNKIFLIGNLTREPRTKKTQNGETITTFGIATNREWTTKGNDKQKSTEFHEVVAWSKLAEICEKLLKKGQLISVEGYLKTRSWESEDGNKQYKTEIVAQNVIILEKSDKNFEMPDQPIETDSHYNAPQEKEIPTIIEEETKEAPPHEDNDDPSDISDITIDTELGL
ncbi:single-stranded DNA-binding protein [Patescibacteria group bacterium]|nr:single-stranded DNA-binding protein [Patescibacteria group bacterium]